LPFTISCYDRLLKRSHQFVFFSNGLEKIRFPHTYRAAALACDEQQE